MLFEGELKSGKTTKLINKAFELLSSDVSSSEILILCANSSKKETFLNKLRDKLLTANIGAVGTLPVYTFNGVVYNSILNNWPLIEQLIKNEENRCVLPILTGMETTQYVLKKCVERADFSDYASKINLLHQLLRRYRLISENDLNDEEVKIRAEILKESFADSAKSVLSQLKLQTTNARCFDYLKQTNTFLYLLKQDKIKDFDNIKYFLADDVDEITFAGNIFIEHILNKTKAECYFAADPDGSTRRGYLCAYTQIWEKLKTISKGDVIKLTTEKTTYNDAMSLFKNIKFNEKNNLNLIEYDNQTTITEMTAKILEKIEILLKTEVSPEQITIITPESDESLKISLVDFFEQNKISYQFLSGSKKIIDDSYVSAVLTVAQLTNKNKRVVPSIFEIRNLLTNILQIPVFLCKEILEAYKKSKKLKDDVVFECEEFNDKYKGLLNVINDLSEQEIDLYDRLIQISSRLIFPLINENTNPESLNKMFASLEEFSKITAKLNYKIENFENEWLIHIKNTIVSDNPPSAETIKSNSIIIATPQKAVDMEIESDYQIWVNTSSREWVKEDTGPLYNSWVFQKSWTDDEYTPEMHRELTNAKTAHLMRKLVLCANKQIYSFSAQLNSIGGENTGTLHEFIDPQSIQRLHNFKEIIPRKDQLPVIEYKKGKMAVPAVPGAGKTTIMLALIIELLKRGVNPPEILVLTYMESAARNFRERIKKACPDLKDMPNISTIHGLAYKILQEENNCAKLGLDCDFSVCDDTEKSKIIREVCLKHLPFGEDELKWIELNTAAISKAKTSLIEFTQIEDYLKTNTNQHLKEFLPVYKEYTQTLLSLNLVDYDDLLVMAVKLLKEHSEIRKYYQNVYQYVIEDEAQDSSAVQQELITIISEKSGNLIRCGDVNQAIMNTFTNADVKGFKDFIAKNHKVEMKSSQRCAKEIYELANYIIDWSKQFNYTKNAFYDIKMLPVTGGNPEVENSLNFKVYEDTNEEKEGILGEITQKLNENPAQTFGILLRNNFQVIDWANFLEKRGIKTICRTDTLKQKKVFRLILKFLEVLESPWNNKLIAELYKELAEQKFIKDKSYKLTVEFLSKSLGSPFITYEHGSEAIREIETEQLLNFWWDIHYWLENSHLPEEQLIIKLGNYYFTDVLDCSNVRLLSVLAEKFKFTFERSLNSPQASHTKANLGDIIKYFKELLKAKRVNIKFFSEEDNAKDNSLNGYVQVMTLHKSKGDEFDTVFIPEMYDSSFAIEPETVKIKQDRILIENIGMLAGKKKQTEEELTNEQIEETLRLIYVGITRAQRYLYLSSASKKVTRYGKFVEATPSALLIHLINNHSKNMEASINAR